MIPRSPSTRLRKPTMRTIEVACPNALSPAGKNAIPTRPANGSKTTCFFVTEAGSNASVLYEERPASFSPEKPKPKPKKR